MFENRRARRKRRFVLAAVFLMLSGIAFGLGYYFNMDNGDNVLLSEEPKKTNLRIPDSLINPDMRQEPFNEEITEEITDETSDMTISGVITEETVLNFRTLFSLCGHSVEKSVPPTEDEINMTELQIRAKYKDWELVHFSPQIINFEREIDTHCPKHFIIGIDNGYIVIFVYNENGERIIKERTDVSVSILTPEDQKSLESGIIADTEDDLMQKLEGFSE